LVLLYFGRQSEKMTVLSEGLIENAVAIGVTLSRFRELDLNAAEAHPPGSVRYVYCAGMEACSLEQFRRTLAAIMGILEPGGLIRIATRDLDAIIFGYLLDWSSSASGESRAMQFNAWRQNETAQYLFNEEDLRAELEKAGFVDVWRLPAGASSVQIFHECEQPGSAELALEARKSALTE
jgi:hypothetical protein